MKLIAILFTGFMLVALASPAFALTEEPGYDYGFSFGAVRGDNQFDRENLGPHMRVHIGIDLTRMLYTEFGGRLAFLDADANKRGNKGYNAQELVIDGRLVFSPLEPFYVEPYVFAGIGAGLNIGSSDGELVPLVPLGFGLRFQLSDQLMLDLNGTYDLVLSDKLDGLDRTSYLNPLTDDKHDSFYSFMLGLTFVPKRVDEEALLAEKRRMEEEARQAALRADPDGDGLTTGDEQSTWGTNPQVADTDGDGLKDGAEVNTYDTDPLAMDTDEDGLSDGAEVKQYATNPLHPDSDGDGLMDGQEVNDYGTNPAEADTDMDGLSDGDEVNKYKTNPTMADTDGGGMKDGLEITKGRDPFDPADDGMVLETGKSLVLEGINFELNSAKLTSESVHILEEALQGLKDFPDAEVMIIGHSDSSGNDDYNMELSRKRAEAVKQWMVDHGIASERLEAIGKGETEPIADNSTAEGRAKNRRIEFKVK